MIETILCGLPIVVKGISISLGILAYVVATVKLIMDSKHKKLGWTMGIAGIIGGFLILAYNVGMTV